jgi:hypothetical protein
LWSNSYGRSWSGDETNADLFEGKFEMKTARYLDEEVVIKKGMQALIGALGSVEAVRFMTLSRERRIESVKRHREWQETLNKDEFFDDVFAE